MSLNIKESAKDLAKTTMFVKEHCDDHIKESRDFTKKAFFSYSDLKNKMPELNTTQTTVLGAGAGGLAGAIGMPVLQGLFSKGKQDDNSSLTTALLGGILGAGAGGGLSYLASKDPTNIKVKRGTQSATLMPEQINKAWDAEKALSGQATSSLRAALGESGPISTPVSIGLGTAGIAGVNELFGDRSYFGRPLRDTLLPNRYVDSAWDLADPKKDDIIRTAASKLNLDIAPETGLKGLTNSQTSDLKSVAKHLVRRRGLAGLGTIAALLGLGKLGLTMAETRRLNEIQNNVASKLEE